jgi:V/A-type H+-transporting ATPase subunit I
LYGSIFGYEEILPALWKSPIHHPILMLKIALGYGVLFIVTACLLAIYNRLGQATTPAPCSATTASSI